MSTTTSSTPLPPSFTLALGALGITTGCAALAPSTAPAFARHFGLPDRAAWHHFVRATGARNVSVGLSVVALGLRRDWRAVGTVLVCGTVTGLVDAVVTWRYGDNPGKVDE
ncbi:uncharacterized protein HO173_006212 [Neofusicoccum parvum]|uniref:Uncharacterized protein HO173_006212 n=1 Tax=Neofusicoccum parvum TaxID=310453 RepID=A0ACB5SBY5_9PEZI|nr:uncharacterized protein HO173_006212 [Neofusicoccum parvum]